MKTTQPRKRMTTKTITKPKGKQKGKPTVQEKNDTNDAIAEADRAHNPKKRKLKSDQTATDTTLTCCLCYLY